jgi:hypothetical protein
MPEALRRWKLKAPERHGSHWAKSHANIKTSDCGCSGDGGKPEYEK